MATPGVGTLKNRLLEQKGHVWAKTGTLSGISGLAGYVTSINNENYVFSILIQNFPGESDDAKALEDELKRSIQEKKDLRNQIKELNLLKEEILVIGDGENDLEMFSNYPKSGCPSHCAPCP